jgi:hypothetical protein
MEKRLNYGKADNCSNNSEVGYERTGGLVSLFNSAYLKYRIGHIRFRERRFNFMSGFTATG